MSVALGAYRQDTDVVCVDCNAYARFSITTLASFTLMNSSPLSKLSQSLPLKFSQ